MTLDAWPLFQSAQPPSASASRSSPSERRIDLDAKETLGSEPQRDEDQRRDEDANDHRTADATREARAELRPGDRAGADIRRTGPDVGEVAGRNVRHRAH